MANVLNQRTRCAAQLEVNVVLIRHLGAIDSRFGSCVGCLMKIALLVVLFASPSFADGQTGMGPKDPPSATEVIRADRARADAREESASKWRPWDRDANGKRPWDRKEVPLPKE